MVQFSGLACLNMHEYPTCVSATIPQDEGLPINILESAGRRGKDEKRLLGWMFGQGEVLVRWYAFGLYICWKYHEI